MHRAASRRRLRRRSPGELRAVQVPPKLLPAFEDALHEPRISAPEASSAEQASAASRRPTDILLKLARLIAAAGSSWASAS
jgi:hypothetical protein